MSRKYKIRDQSALHFVTFTVIHWEVGVLSVQAFQFLHLFSKTAFPFLLAGGTDSGQRPGSGR
jgi:hypothetical protein